MTNQNKCESKEKNISQIIEELKTFEDLEMTVMVSDD